MYNGATRDVVIILTTHAKATHVHSDSEHSTMQKSGNYRKDVGENN
jgi:hypothetical protein